MPVDISKFIGRFVEEAREQIGRLTEGLAVLASDGDDTGDIHAVFRAAHTIKGSARMLNLGPLAETAHSLEELLGALRENRIVMDPRVRQLLYQGVDALAAAVEQLDETRDPAGLPQADITLAKALAEAAAGVIAASPKPPGQALVTFKAIDSVRVRLSRLDALINLMGEVISSHAPLHRYVQDLREIERRAAGIPAATALHVDLQRLGRKLRRDIQSGSALMAELHHKALLMRMLPLAMVFEPAGRMTRELAQTMGKQVTCEIHGAEIELDRQMIDTLADPVIHLLRNAVDHGLETPSERVAAGKSPQGRITLAAQQDGGWVLIEVRDDGRGISLDAVRTKAVHKGILTKEKAATAGDRELTDLIFMPGFSTSSIITDLSGRGVGMDVVRQCIINDLQGTISVSSSSGAGTSFSLRLPLSLAQMRVLLVSAGGGRFGFTAPQVAQLLRAPFRALLDVAERQVVIMHNELIPVVALTDLLRVGQKPLHAAASSPKELLLVVLEAGNQKLALIVDDVLDARDMVIKPLPEHLRHCTLASGLVTTDHNELVSLLHVPALLELAAKAHRHDSGATALNRTDRPPVWKILVVDDSLNTREIEKDMLEAHGFAVTLAEDGMDGLNKAMAQQFDAVLTDVEMPNMDGFSFTRQLRQAEGYDTAPIIIVTSRTKEEDKRRGIEAGADAYIVKSDFEQTSLVETLRTLLGGRPS